MLYLQRDSPDSLRDWLTNSIMRHKFKIFNFIMAAIIFLAAAIELYSWYLSFGKPAIIIDYGDGYLTDGYPKANSAVIWLFALGYFIKSLLFEVCIYTKIVSISYIIIQTVNLIALFTEFGFNTYNLYIYPVFLFTILALTIVKIIRCLLK